VSALVVGIILDRGREEGVDKCRLSEARLARHLCLLERAIPAMYVLRTMIVKAAPRFATILCLLNVRLERDACTCAFAFDEDVPLVGQLRCMLADVNNVRGAYTYIGNANWGRGFGHGVLCVEDAGVGVSEAAISGGIREVARAQYQRRSAGRDREGSFCYGVGGFGGWCGECCVAVLLYNLASSPFSARPLGRREA
jgi:hypothetical protein